MLWLTAVSSIATFLVIAVTAYAAVRQLRHVRSGNHVAALLTLTEKYQFVAFGFVIARFALFAPEISVVAPNQRAWRRDIERAGSGHGYSRYRDWNRWWPSIWHDRTRGAHRGQSGALAGSSLYWCRVLDRDRRARLRSAAAPMIHKCERYLEDRPRDV